MTDMLTALAAPFDPDIISWRVGSTTQAKDKGMALGYIDARDVMERLDTVVGAANWQDRYEFHGPRTLCYLSIRVDGEWVTKADGAGDSDVESEKGAISDALKRAAVKWGIGRYLYDLASPWVEIEGAGRSYRIKASERQKLVAAARAGASVANRIAAERATDGLSAAADHAIAQMSRCKTPDEFKAFWEPNKDGLKAALPELEWRRVLKAKDVDVARLTAAKTETPFDQKEAA